MDLGRHMKENGGGHGLCMIDSTTKWVTGDKRIHIGRHMMTVLLKSRSIGVAYKN
jgi:hypothetical protein